VTSFGVLEFWKLYIENNQPKVFETLHDFLSETNLNLSQDIKEQIIHQLNGLKTAFKKYFPKHGKEDHWIALFFSENHFQSAALYQSERKRN